MYGAILGGNDQIEEAISKFYDDSSNDNMMAVLETVIDRMHAGGHFILPVLVNEEDETQFSLQNVQADDGKLWNVAFTSREEYEKGAEFRVVSDSIDNSMKMCLKAGTKGFIINPWGQQFYLTRNLIEDILDENGDQEYYVPDDPITPGLLEDGSFLKRVVRICYRNSNILNIDKLTRILRHSRVWVPFYDMEPDILQKGEDYYFPVFTTVEEMCDYGDEYSKVQMHFLEAADLAMNNEMNDSGIMINVFSEQVVVSNDRVNNIIAMKSIIEE